VACDHSGTHNGESRYLRDAGLLRLVLVCDACGAECAELERIGYRPEARFVDGHLAELTARQLGLSEPTIARVRLAALLCDVGRDQIPREILNKRGPLDDREWSQIRRQPELGAALLSDVSFDDIRDWILCHHERPDGRGYPRGLLGDQIPLEARIVAVIDAYTAMRADRPYRLARSHEEACDELRRCAGSQFDAAVVQAFLRVTTPHGRRRAARSRLPRGATPRWRPSHDPRLSLGPDARRP
jgi:HD-GYP domain-containing protein (c-di-GMP phosphodiesterase class II)